MTKPTETPKTNPKAATKTKPTFLIIASLGISLGLSALGISLYLTHLMHQQNKHVESTLTMLTQQQSGTEARLQAHRLEVQTRDTDANVALLALKENLKSTLGECRHVSDDWRLEKARYLLELAQEQAHWTHNSKTTEAMLKEADTILAPLRNPQLLAIREALAHDVSEQKNTPSNDTTALLAALNSAEKSTWTLPVVPLPKDKDVLANKGTTKNNRLMCALDAIKGLAVIRHTSDAMTPKPTLAYEAILRATVRLNLQEAAWAVMEKNDTVYQLALSQAITHLEQTFTADAQQTKTLVSDLNQLKQTKLYQDVPVPKRALSLLNQMMTSNQSNMREPKIEIKGDAS